MIPHFAIGLYTTRCTLGESRTECCWTKEDRWYVRSWWIMMSEVVRRRWPMIASPHSRAAKRLLCAGTDTRQTHVWEASSQR